MLRLGSIPRSIPLVGESADMLYHLQVLMLAKGLTPADVYRHL